MTYINLLIMVLKLVVSSLTYLRLSTKFWHKGLIYKLKQNGVAGNLLKTLADFLKDTKQRVVLNGQNSTWVNVEAGFLKVQFLERYFS